MDTETNAAIERLRDEMSEQIGGVDRRLDRLEVTMRSEFAGLRGELHEGLADVRADLRAEFRDGLAEVRADLRAEFRDGLAEVRADLRAELRDGLAEVRGELRDGLAAVRGELRDGLSEVRGEVAESRRHSEVLHETLRDDIRILAEGFAAISNKLDAMQQ